MSDEAVYRTAPATPGLLKSTLYRVHNIVPGIALLFSLLSHIWPQGPHQAEPGSSYLPAPGTTSLLLVLPPSSWYYLPPPGTTSLLQVWMRAHIPGETNTELGARAHVGDFKKSGCSSSIRTANLGAKK